MTTDQMRRAGWLPVPGLLVAVIVLAWLRLDIVWQPPLLLPVLNIALLSAISLLISFLAASSFQADHSLAVLLLGCGTTVLGLGSAIASRPFWPPNPNWTVTVYNISACLAAACHLFSAAGSYPAIPWRGRIGWPIVVCAYAAAIVIVSLLAAAVYDGLLPVFFVQGRGGTTWNLAVLHSAIAMFTAAGVLLLIEQRRSPYVFLYWYGLGLLLIAVGLLGVSLQTRFGSPLNWTGRTAQYLGGIYMLIAAVASFKKNDTWRINLQARLRQSEQQYQNLVEVSPDAILVILNEHYVFANSAALTLFGAKSVQELGAVSVLELVAPEYREESRQRIRHVLSTGQPNPLRTATLLRVDGQPIDVEAASCRMEYQGQAAIQAVLRDVTDRKRAEGLLCQAHAELEHRVEQRTRQLEQETLQHKLTAEALRQSEDELRSAAKAATFGTYSYDFATGQGHWSAELKALYGLDGAAMLELDGDLVAKAIHPDDRADFLAAMTAANDPRGDGMLQLEYRVIWPDNSIHWLMVRGCTSFADDGQQKHPLRAHGTAIDITQRKQLEAQLLQAQKLEAIGQLAGGVAHNFRNLLAVIKGYGEALLRRGLVAPAGQPAVQEILQATDQAAGLIAQLLSFSSKDMLRPRLVNLSELVATIGGPLEQLVGRQVTVSIPAGTDSVFSNLAPSQFEQAIMNLAANAADAMPQGGTFTIDVSRIDLDSEALCSHPDASPGAYACVTVRDTGCGMDRATLDRLFEPFFTTKRAGTGLGLPMVYGFVRQSGGFISVDSQVGRGSTFKLFFPCADAHAFE